MNLRRAIRYPYQNMAKILTMVLILAIALVAFASLIERGEQIRGDWPYRSYLGSSLDDYGLAGLFLSVIGFVIWLGGYSLDVIRHASQGYSSLPAINVSQNVAHGLALWLSRLLWLMLGTMFVLDNIEAASGQSHVMHLLLCAFYLIVALESVAAAVRCAVLKQASAAFAFPRNLRLLLENKRAFTGLIARLLLLNAAYVIANNAYVQTMTWIERTLKFDNYLIFIGVFCVGVLIFLVQTISSLHLIGQFAYRVEPLRDRRPY